MFAEWGAPVWNRSPTVSDLDKETGASVAQDKLDLAGLFRAVGVLDDIIQGFGKHDLNRAQLVVIKVQRPERGHGVVNGQADILEGSKEGGSRQNAARSCDGR